MEAKSAERPRFGRFVKFNGFIILPKSTSEQKRPGETRSVFAVNTTQFITIISDSFNAVFQDLGIHLYSSAVLVGQMLPLMFKACSKDSVPHLRSLHSKS